MLHHPNILQVYDILETGNNYYLITELCSGGDLIDMIADKVKYINCFLFKQINQRWDVWISY